MADLALVVLVHLAVTEADRPAVEAVEGDVPAAVARALRAGLGLPVVGLLTADGSVQAFPLVLDDVRWSGDYIYAAIQRLIHGARAARELDFVEVAPSPFEERRTR